MSRLISEIGLCGRCGTDTAVKVYCHDCFISAMEVKDEEISDLSGEIDDLKNRIDDKDSEIESLKGEIADLKIKWPE